MQVAVLTFLSDIGDDRRVDASPGMSIMEAALQADVPGIEGECGGAGICGTCHVVIDAGWVGQLGRAEADEEDMLDAFGNREPGSRLSCQIQVTAMLDGLLLRVPSIKD